KVVVDQASVEQIIRFIASGGVRRVNARVEITSNGFSLANELVKPIRADAVSAKHDLRKIGLRTHIDKNDGHAARFGDLGSQHKRKERLPDAALVIPDRVFHGGLAR